MQQSRSYLKRKSSLQVSTTCASLSSSFLSMASYHFNLLSSCLPLPYPSRPLSFPLPDSPPPYCHLLVLTSPILADCRHWECDCAIWSHQSRLIYSCHISFHVILCLPLLHAASCRVFPLSDCAQGGFDEDPSQIHDQILCGCFP